MYECVMFYILTATTGVRKYLSLFVEPRVNFPPTVLGVFHLFFTTTLIASIVEQTNMYAKQVSGDEIEAKWRCP